MGTSKTTTSAEIRSIIRNTLLASPEFPIFCQQLGISPVLTPAETKMLAERYVSPPEDIDMPVHPNVKVCTHIKVTGVRCGSPALRGEEFCYFHQRMFRALPPPPTSRPDPVLLLENQEARQCSLMEVINAVIRGPIDLQRAE